MVENAVAGGDSAPIVVRLHHHSLPAVSISECYIIKRKISAAHAKDSVSVIAADRIVATCNRHLGRNSG